MSAGMMGLTTQPKVDRDPSKLAPKFLAALMAALAECEEEGLDAYLYEGYRSNALQQIYYERGRTVRPPYETVTNAKSNLYSWHGFGLAGDIISKSKGWQAGYAWFARVGAIMKKHGLDWGGDWQRVDLPHVQWGSLRITPSDRARTLLASGGMEAVWREVGADGPPVPPVAPRPRILTMGVVGEDVKELQKALGAPVTGVFDAITDAWVRGFQRGKGLKVDGDVGPDTVKAIG